MNKLKKLLAAFLFFFLLAFPSISHADQLKSIDINVDIDHSGIGHVTEVWETVDDNEDATEKYKVISDLNGIKIRDFSVSANGKDFTKKEPWNIDASFEEKANSYGMVEDGDRVELCWGITNFGENTFTLNYKIDPVVVGLNDYDMVYFRFIKENLDPLPDKIRIQVNGYEPFDEEVGMWGMGFEGEVHNVDGSIIAESSGHVDYAVVMLRFPKGTFDTSYIIDEDFSYYRNMAIEGSDWEEIDEGNYSDGPYAEEGYPQSNSRGFFRGLFPSIWIIFLILVSGLGIGSASAAANKYKIQNKDLLEKEKNLKTNILGKSHMMAL